MIVSVADNPGESRYEIRADGELAGFSVYDLQRHTIGFTHTEIDPKLGGHGLGSRLVGEALDDARRRELDVVPYCSFVRSYIDEHPEYAELVPERHRTKQDRA